MCTSRPGRTARAALVLALSTWLAACGGGDGSSPPPPADGVLAEANAWSGPLPDAASLVSPDAFRATVASGQGTLAGPAADTAHRSMREHQFAEDRAYLGALGASSPAARALVAAAARVSDPLADVPITVDGVDHPLLVHGPAAAMRALSEAQRRSLQAANALAVYRRLHELLSEPVQAGLPTPDSLAGQGLDAVNEALAEANRRLAARPVAQRTARQGPRPAGPRVHALELDPYAGSDHDNADCKPTHLMATHWFPLKYFLGPAKMQGQRSTCWAFAAVGAVEIRERVQNDRVLNLSEQFLVNQVRQKWFPNDAVESGSAASGLNAAAAASQVLPDESVWPYNPSSKRVSPKTFAGVCDPYGQGAGLQARCSETSHQGPQLCTDANGRHFCLDLQVNYSGPGAGPGTVATLWTSGKPFPLASIVQFLDSGVPLLATMPVHRGFQRIDNAAGSSTRGVLTDLAPVHFDADRNADVEGSDGDHEVLIVGFLSNDQLSQPGAPVDVPGGGYFIVRNSWGCNFGDAGHAYVPAQYVQDRFGQIDLPEFGSARSDAWVVEQASPGQQLAPLVTAVAPVAQADLRVPKDLAALVTVRHPVARLVRVVITSDVEGTLYDGPWITDPAVLDGTHVPHAFTATGRHLLGVQAFYGAQSDRAGVAVDVVNTPPTVRLLGSGVAHQGEPYAITAQVSDLNEGNGSALCERTRWKVTAPDTLTGTQGCAQQVSFGATGPRPVEVTTLDLEGLATTALVKVEVQPPAANPYPRITAAALLSRELAGAPFKACRDVATADGGLIDLREAGCIASAGEAAPQRYSARVDVENPSAEVLAYEWNLFVTTEGVESNLFGGPMAAAGNTVTLYSPGPSLTAAATLLQNCRLTVTVHAPQAERDKTRTVWSGRCAYALPGPA